MATRTLTVAGGNFQTAATWVENAVPTAADDVVLPSGAGNLVIDGTSVCRSFVEQSGYTGIVTLNGTSFSIGDGSGGAFTLVSGSTFAVTAGTFNFVSTSTNGGAGWGITTAGKNMPTTVFNGVGGKWTLQDSYTCPSTRTITLTAGELKTNSQSVSAGSATITGSTTRVLTLDASSLTFTISGTPWSAGTLTNFTMTANTATVTCTGSNSTFSSSSFNYNGLSVVSSGSGSFTLVTGGTYTFANFTRTGTAAKTDSLIVSGSTVCTSTFTCNGNSATNRMLVQSNTVGTARGITAATVTVTNTDFMDISGGGAGSWNLSAITGGSGDCGGNSGITFTAVVTRYGVVAGNWSSTATWSTTSGGAGGSSVPLAQDTVILDANSAAGTYTADMPRLCKDLTCTGFTRTLALNSTQNSVFGSLTLASGMTVTATTTTTLAGRGTHTVTHAGKSPFAHTFQGPGGTYTLQDAFSLSSALTINDGTFTTNNQTVSCTTFAAASGRTTIVNLGSSVVSLTSTSTSTIINIGTTTTTINAGTSEFVVANASASTRTIGWLQSNGTLNKITYTVAASSGILLLTTSTTGSFLNTLNVGVGKTVTITAGRMIHLRDAFSSGSSGNLITLNSASSGSPTTISKQYTGPQGNVYSFFGTAKAIAGYLDLDGASGSYMSTPDSVALSITGDIALEFDSAASDWTPSAAQQLIAKDFSTTARSYRFNLNADGTIRLLLSSDGGGAGQVSASSSVTVGSTGVADGGRIKLAVEWRQSDGRVRFYYRFNDNDSWTQLGSDQTIAIASIFDGTAAVEIGSFNGGTTTFNGKVYKAVIRSGDLSTGTIISAPDFTTPTANNHEYLSIKDSTVIGLGSWYAANSTNVSGNTNWNFGYGLEVADGSHSHSTDGIVLTQAHVLQIADALNAHLADNITLTQAHTLVLDDALHDHSVDNITLTQAHVLSILDALHDHTADNLLLVYDSLLTLADALHDHTAESPTVILNILLVLVDALHQHLADNVGFLFQILDALHGHTADNIILTVTIPVTGECLVTLTPSAIITLLTLPRTDITLSTFPSSIITENTHA